MTARQAWKVGDLARTECDDLQWVRTIAVVPVLSVLRLHCGCDKLRVPRPGVATEDNRWKSEMELFANRCGLHADKRPAEPERVDSGSEAA